MADTDLGTDTLRLLEYFPPVTTAEWEAVIQADLKGADYEKKLVWRTEEGIPVRPYYRSENLKGLEPQTKLIPGVFPYVRGSGTQTWKLVEPGSDLPSGAIRADLIHEQGGTAVQELGYGIAAGVDKLVEASEHGIDIDAAAKSINFVFAVGSNFFFEIAKLRAARMLWARAVSAFQPQSEASCLMRIHVRTALSNKSIYDPYTNLLRATTEALSAVIGGCDSLEVQPFRFSGRLATNLQRVIREESHVAKVADPAGGSYYVEALTAAIAAEAWKLFQQVEAEGGYAKAKASIDSAIAQSRAAKEKAIGSRRKVMVGVNNYPDLNETLDEPVSTPQDIWRAAEVFEKIRLRTEAHTAKTGKRPSILLLEHGDLKMRQARSQFCQNFFGCGGFEIVVSQELEGTTPDLIVLCSSDAEYLPLAHEVCSKVSQPVIVAGNPKEQIEQLQAAGVAGFVHVLSNAVETLGAWQTKLGMKE